MPTVEAKRTINPEPNHMAGRYELLEGKAKIGNTVAILDAENNAYNLARISGKWFPKTNVREEGYRLIVLTGDRKGDELFTAIVAPKGKTDAVIVTSDMDAAKTANVGAFNAPTHKELGQGDYLNTSSISREPQNALDRNGSAQTVLINRSDLEIALKGDNTKMLVNRLALVHLRDEGENAYALVEILAWDGKSKYSAGNFIHAGFKANLITTTPSERPRPHRIQVDISDIVEHPSYELLK